ncbi:hypothetical protein [Azospirillum sp.]
MPPPKPSVPPAGTIEVEFATARLGISGAVDPVVISTVVAALMGQPA